MKPLKLSLLAMVFLLSFISCSEEDMASEITEDCTHSGFGIMQNSNGSYYFTQLFYKS